MAGFGARHHVLEPGQAVRDLGKHEQADRPNRPNCAGMFCYNCPRTPPCQDFHCRLCRRAPWGAITGCPCWAKKTIDVEQALRDAAAQQKKNNHILGRAEWKSKHRGRGSSKIGLDDDYARYRWGSGDERQRSKSDTPKQDWRVFPFLHQKKSKAKE